MHIFLVTEIWGHTPHLAALAESLNPLADHVTVVDPYDGSDPAFTTEEDAYAAFLDRCGHAAYADRLRSGLQNETGPVLLVGFSAGAGAVWDVVCDQNTENVLHAVCFYGSAIRHMADRVPSVDTDLIFPEHESHFDVAELIRRLGAVPRTACLTVPQGHGFMNPLSSNYDEQAAREWSEWLCSLAGRPFF